MKKSGEKLHLHLHELPKSMVRRGSDAEAYRDDVMRAMVSLQFNYEKLIHSAQICYLNLDSVMGSNPYMPEPPDVFYSVQEFVYHYENYCMRAFILREKILNFINEVLPVDWPKNDVNMKTMTSHSTVKAAGLDKLLSKFDGGSSNPMGKLIKDRNHLTHKLYYGTTDHFLRPYMGESMDSEDGMKQWFKDWKTRVKAKERIVTSAAVELFAIQHELAEKVYDYKRK